MWTYTGFLKVKGGYISSEWGTHYRVSKTKVDTFEFSAKYHIIYDTKKSENSLCFSEHWPLLWRVWKLGCARIGCPFWLSEKSPNVKIADGLLNLWLIMMGMGLCRVWCVPPLAPAPPNHTQPHPIPQHVPSPHQEHPAPITNTTPGNANKTSTIHLWLKM